MDLILVGGIYMTICDRFWLMGEEIEREIASLRSR
jgi:hypothetical protein